MKKLSRALFVVTFLLLGIMSQGYAYTALIGQTVEGYTVFAQNPTGTMDGTYKGYLGDNSLGSYSGYYLGTIDIGNGTVHQDLFEELASAYLGSNFDAEAYFEADPGQTVGSLTVGAGGLYGTWALSSPYAIGFYGVKAADQFAIYYVDPYQTSGYWSTQHLQNDPGNIPTLSHLDAAAASVPEPATMFLLGLGLVGLAGVGRKFKM